MKLNKLGALAQRVIKKYPNRRLYDTATSSYITLTEVKQMVMGGEIVSVHDARSSQDLTHSVLLQILFEAESNGSPLFSAGLLASMIRFYGSPQQGLMSGFLEQNIEALNGQMPLIQAGPG